MVTVARLLQNERALTRVRVKGVWAVDQSNTPSALRSAITALTQEGRELGGLNSGSIQVAANHKPAHATMAVQLVPN